MVNDVAKMIHPGPFTAYPCIKHKGNRLNWPVKISLGMEKWIGFKCKPDITPVCQDTEIIENDDYIIVIDKCISGGFNVDEEWNYKEDKDVPEHFRFKTVN